MAATRKLVYVSLIATVFGINHVQPVEASPTYACVSKDEKLYHAVDEFVRGWSGYQLEDAYVVAVCRTNKMVTIRVMSDSPDAYHAGAVVVRMAASVGSETLNDVVDRFVWQKYEATISKVERDGCICEGNN